MAIHRSVILLSLALSCALLAGCNRAMVRIPGASSDFPETHSGFVAQRPISAILEVAVPDDARRMHYKDSVAGTHWNGCSTDTMWSETAPEFLRERLAKEIVASKIFLPAQATDTTAPHLVMHSEIDAFCSQAAGILFMRVVGIAAIKFSLVRDGRTIWERKLERVVTDADPEYTGGEVGFIEQAMRATMADSLRLILRDLLQNMDESRGNILAS